MTNEELQTLRKKIKIELARAEIEKSRVEEVRRLRVAEQYRIGRIESVLERYAHLAEGVSGLLEKLNQLSALDKLQRLPAIDDTLREWLPHLSERIERIEDVQLLMLASGEFGQTGVVEARRALKKERREQLRNQLKIHYRSLHILEEQAAKMGQSPTIEKLNAIQFAQEKIEELEVLLGE